MDISGRSSWRRTTNAMSRRSSKCRRIRITRALLERIDRSTSIDSGGMCHDAGRRPAMRYMMLIYSKEQPGGPGQEMAQRNYTGHLALMQEAARKGVFVAAEPLAPTASATTVRVENGKALVTDGPFAE